MSDTTAGSPIVSPPRRSSRFTTGGLVTGLLAAVILALLVGGYLLYTSEEGQLADSRQSNASLSQQLSKAQQETKDRQSDLDSTKQQLAGAQTATLDAQAAAKALTDQLSQSQKLADQAQAQAKSLQAEKDDLTARLASAQKASQDAQSANASLQQKSRQALAKAQLVDQFVKIGTEPSNDRKTQLTLNWLTNLSALGDPTVDGYLQAFMKNPKDSAPLNKLIVYLSNGVVDDLQ